jgi:hypothetical protein
MSEMNNMERRKYTRFRTQGNAYAALRGNTSKVGKIYDISLNGVGFRYLADRGRRAEGMCVPQIPNNALTMLFNGHYTATPMKYNGG